MDVALGPDGRLTGLTGEEAEPDVRVRIDARLQQLHFAYDEGDVLASLEAVAIVGLTMRMPLGGGYVYRWPPLPADWKDAETEAVIGLWRGMKRAEAGAAMLKAAGNAAEIAQGLRLMLSGVVEAERGGGLLGRARG